MYYALVIVGVIVLVVLILSQKSDDQEAERLYKSLPSDKRKSADRFINWLAKWGK